MALTAPINPNPTKVAQSFLSYTSRSGRHSPCQSGAFLEQDTYPHSFLVGTEAYMYSTGLQQDMLGLTGIMPISWWDETKKVTSYGYVNLPPP